MICGTGRSGFCERTLAFRQAPINGDYSMPTSKEFTIRMQDRPGTLGKVSKALADQQVNIVAFQSFPSTSEGESTVRMIFDNHSRAKNVLDAQNVNYEEKEVARITLPNRPGELARAASSLGEADININYAYTGVDPETDDPLLFFGVNEVSKAANILDQKVSKAA
jgi:hypothetical protein